MKIWDAVIILLFIGLITVGFINDNKFKKIHGRVDNLESMINLTSTAMLNYDYKITISDTIRCPFCRSEDYTGIYPGKGLILYKYHTCNSCNKLFTVEEHRHPSIYITKPYRGKR